MTPWESCPTRLARPVLRDPPVLGPPGGRRCVDGAKTAGVTGVSSSGRVGGVEQESRIMVALMQAMCNPFLARPARRDVGQPLVAAAVAEGQPRVVEAEQVQDRGVQVVDVDRSSTAA